MNMSSHYSNTQPIKSQWPSFTSVALACAISVCSVSAAYADARDEAKRMHDRLAGVPPTEEVLCAMAADISAGNPEDAAKIVMETGAVTDPSAGNACSTGSGHTGTIDNSASKKAFYSVSLKNFVTPWTNVDQTIFAPLNDYTATVIGIIRDDLDFREVLTGNFIYKNPAAAYSDTDNTAYENLESSHADLSLSSNLAKANQSWPDPGGVTTTRAAGEAFFKAGTNRRMFRFTMINYLCRDMEELKDTTRVPDRIRQDVSRSPGGDSSIFLNSCIGCHSGMDPLAGAYAYYDWAEDTDGANGHITYSTSIVHDLAVDPPIKHKYLINASNFPNGYITTDDSWKNYWREGPNSQLEWDATGDTPVSPGATPSGNGVNSMNKEIANSKAFFKCQVEKVYTHVCLQSPIYKHTAAVQSITDSFMTDPQHSLRKVFAATAALCSGN